MKLTDADLTVIRNHAEGKNDTKTRWVYATVDQVLAMVIELQESRKDYEIRCDLSGSQPAGKRLPEMEDDDLPFGDDE